MMTEDDLPAGQHAAQATGLTAAPTAAPTAALTAGPATGAGCAGPGGGDPALTEDGFLGNRLRVRQPRTGFRAGADSVLLAAAVPAAPGQRVLELGCGAGVASLCLGVRVPNLDLHAVERQPDYAQLAQENAMRNQIALHVACADLAALPPFLRTEFDHVLANPPYFVPGAGTQARDPGREAALREETPLQLWLDVARRRLRPGGWLTLIQLASRLPDVLAALGGGLGSVSVLPLAARQGRAAGRVIVRARKGGKAPFQLLAPLVLHASPQHLHDGADLSDDANLVLANGGAIDLLGHTKIFDP